MPIDSLGVRMDNECLIIAVGLLLGIPICGLHPCRHCGPEVDVTGKHALSCRAGECRLHRHSALNDIIYRTLVSAHVPSRWSLLVY